MTTTRIAAPPALPMPEIALLLAPISAEKPSGDSLRFDAVYDDIKKLREEDDPTLPVGVWQRELKRADWPGVASVATDALTTRSKDLQLAAWLTEAWTKMHAFAGLAHGIRLIAALCDTFWETLHPQIEEGSAESRVAPIAWLSGEKFLFTVKSVPAVPAREVRECLAAVDQLKAMLLARLAERDAPNLTPLRSTLAEIARQEVVPAMEPESVAAGVSRPDSDEGPAEAGPYTGTITTRAEAYARLREAADFLLRTEPHSPVPYLVRRAVAWGNMSLAELLEQLLQKNADLNTIYTLLGIKGR